MLAGVLGSDFGCCPAGLNWYNDRMKRHRRQKTDHAHYCILVNPTATNYSERRISRLTSAIHKAGRQYTVVQPKSSLELYNAAMEVARGGKIPGQGREAQAQRNKVTALIVAGGDGTTNLVARAALESDLPLGILPTGRFNDISTSLHGPVNVDEAIGLILAGEYKTVDVGQVADQIFVGSIGFGFFPSLANQLKDEKPPRFGMGWGKLGQKAADDVKPMKVIVKADSFRFEVKPVILSISLLPLTMGMTFSPASLSDDSRAELIFDDGGDSSQFSGYLKGIFKKSFQYGGGINLYRSELINIQLPRGREMFLDGEQLKVPGQALEIKMMTKKLKLFG